MRKQSTSQSRRFSVLAGAFVFLVAAATALPETPVSFSLPKNSNNNDNKSSNNSNKEQHRRLSNQRVDCPGGIQFCDNPFAIMDDPTVECNEDTCAWLITLLDPGQKPAVCRNIIITGQVSDYLEPCLWWEILFGNLRPTAAPSVSLSPTAVPTIIPPTSTPSSTPSQSWLPSLTPSLAPSLRPSRAPSDWPSILPTGGPTHPPTISPSTGPSVSAGPSLTPSKTLSTVPSAGPSVSGSVAPSAAPSPPAPTAVPTTAPSAVPSVSVAPTQTNERNVLRTFETVLVNYYVAAAEVSASSSSNGGNARRNVRQRRQLQDANRSTLNAVTELHLLTELQLRFGPVFDEVRSVSLDFAPVRTTVYQNGLTVQSEALSGQVVLAWTLGSLRQTVLNQIVREAFQGPAADRYLALLDASGDSVLQRTTRVETGLPPDVVEQDPNADAAGQAGNIDNNNENIKNDNDNDLFSSDNLMWIAVIAGAGAAAIGILVLALLYMRRGRRRNAGPVVIKEAPTGSSTASSPQGTAANGGQGIGKRRSNVADTESARDDTSLADNSHMGQQSTATSVYSYIDANLMDDQSYSVAGNNSYMYGTGVAGDDHSLASRNNWSVGCGSYAAHEASQMSGDELQPSYQISAGDSHNGPEKMVVTTERRNKNDFFLFVDDDDDLSVASDMAKAPTRHPNLSMEISEKSESPLQSPSQQILGAQPNREVTSAELADPQTWAFDDYMDSDEDSQDIGQQAPSVAISSLRRLPLGDLSRVDESESSIKDAGSTSSAGSESSEKQSSALRPDSKENLRNVRDDDDDDSLFLENSMDGKSSLVTSVPSSGSSVKKELSRNSGLQKYHSLNEKEKASLGVQSRRQSNNLSSDDDEEDD